ncbi:hypothetical protein BDW72DRAFT_191663 [Aspergillus terricola var. indicus]
MAPKSTLHTQLTCPGASIFASFISSFFQSTEQRSDLNPGSQAAVMTMQWQSAELSAIAITLALLHGLLIASLNA